MESTVNGTFSNTAYTTYTGGTIIKTKLMVHVNKGGGRVFHITH